MEIIAVACVATIALCAVLARATSSSVKARPLDDKSRGLDKALYHLINEVARRPEPKRKDYIDNVHMASRLRAMHDKRTTAV